MSRIRESITGVIGGSVSGLTGVGGGVTMVPLLSGLVGLRQHRAHATSLVIVIFVAAAAGSLYAARGDVDWWIALALAVGGIGGAQIGARAMHRVPEGRLRIIFAAFLVVVGLRLLILG